MMFAITGNSALNISRIGTNKNGGKRFVPPSITTYQSRITLTSPYSPSSPPPDTPSSLP